MVRGTLGQVSYLIPLSSETGIMLLYFLPGELWDYIHVCEVLGYYDYGAL